MCDLDNISVKPELLFTFFLNYARFEYALKVSGFVKGGHIFDKELKSASPDWGKYANSIKNSFDKDTSTDLREAVDYIWENPPWEEVVTAEGKLLFSSPVYDSNKFDINVLLRFVRRVRNNLFHGGKHVHGAVANDRNTERNEILFKSSLIILDACLKLSPDVKSAYDNGII